MPSVRKSTGRVVTPVRQPEVASAKKAQLEPPALLAFPLRHDIALHAQEGFQSESVVLPQPDRIRAPFAAPASPPIEILEAQVPPAVISSDLTDAFSPASTEGIRWSSERVAGEDEPTAVSKLGRLRPRLAPGLLEGDTAARAFPIPVREDQIETVRRLLEKGEVAVATDPGCGSDESVALAIRELLRTGTIRRGLLLASSELFEYWRRLFELWAPEVCLAFWPTGGQKTVWPEEAHIVLADPIRSDPVGLEPAIGAGGCDLVVLTAFTAYRRRGGDPTSLRAIAAGRRWVVSGGPPPEAEDWRLLHRYFHPQWAGSAALAEIQDRLAKQIVRHKKTSLQGTLPRRSRIEVWLALDEAQRGEYDEALEEERIRLERLGGAVNRTHVLGSLSRLKKVMAFRPGTLDGVKVRVLVDLVEEILASGAKVVVVGPSDPEVLAGLMSVLEAHGASRLDSTAPAEDQAQILSDFRRDPRRRVLIADTETRGDGEPLEGASYIIHFGHEWNPAHRRRTEQRLFPDLGPTVPQTVFELWIADSVEARYHALLASQGLLARDIAHETRPKDIEERLTILEWLSTVFEIGSVPESASGRDIGTGKLPGTGALQEAWAKFDAKRLAGAAESLLRALGFTQVERVARPNESGCDFTGWHTSTAGAERIFIRCLRAPSSVGVDEARQVLEEIPRYEECVGAYLVATADFTSASRKLAEQSEGRLALVDGPEFYRHLRVLGLVGDR
ncbi:MAG TPA: restriction endonuclease [Anaerolineales bacterium]|nr:restriction endonuclease [Anaerolineales bacterium]